MHTLSLTNLLLVIISLSFLAISVECDQVPSVILQGSGAGAPYSLFVLGKERQPGWFPLFTNVSNGFVSTTYMSSTSLAGETAILQRSVDFSASTVPLSESQREQLRSNLIHFPVTLGAVEFTYNIPQSGISGTLNLTASIVAQILQRNITRWDDPQIRAVNPGLTYSAGIAPVVRSDGAGPTFTVSRWLTGAATEWVLGTSLMPAWPAGTVQVSGNGAVVNAVTLTPGSIGYVNHGTANLIGVAGARLRNAKGQWVTPTPASIIAATEVLKDSSLPAGTDSWWDVDLTNQDTDGAWPIVAFTYILFYEDLTDYGPKSAALVGLLTYLNQEKTQQLATLHGFVPLPSWVRYANAGSLDNVILAPGYNATTYYDPTPKPVVRHQSGMASFSIILTVGLFIVLIAVIVYELYIAKRWRE